jgi:hypothetical protein
MNSEVYADNNGPRGGFALRNEDAPVRQSAARFLAAVQHRCPLPPAAHALLAQAQTALARLGASRPEVALVCMVTRRRCSPEGTSECTWGLNLEPHALHLYTKSNVEGTDTFVELPDVAITLYADGRHALNGDPEAWRRQIEEVLTLSPATLFSSGMPTTLTLMLIDLNEGTDLLVKLHAETTLRGCSEPEPR